MSEAVGPPQLPDYDFDRELGRGGMGTVYLYRHAITQRPEVVKLLSPEVLTKPGNRGRFEREIRAAFKLSHPNIVAAYSTHRVGDSLAFCMEYVEGDDLSRVVQQEGPLPAAEACSYIVQACLGLQHACERGMVHRDIKPGNLMRTVVGGRTVVKVVDFGLAKLGTDPESTSETGLTQYGQVLGTPDFIAPEQIRNTSGADIRADLYSLGCTLYFLIAGRPPFRGESLFDLFEMHIHSEAPGLDRVVSDLPPGLAEAVARMMAKNPADRPQTPSEAAEALLPYATMGTSSYPVLPAMPLASSPTAPLSTSRTPPQPPSRRLEPIPDDPDSVDQFVSLNQGSFDPPASSRYKPVKPTPPPPPSKPGWVVPLVVGVFVLTGIGAVVYVLWDGSSKQEVKINPPVVTPPTPAPTPTTRAPIPTTARPTPTTPTGIRTSPTEMKTSPTPPSKPTAPEWYTALFGDPKAGLRQTVWPSGDGWRLRNDKLVAPDAAEDRVALFDDPPQGDFDLTAEVQVTGGAGLMVRGDRRALDGQPTGYLIGLGKSDAPAFECGAIHRWGVKHGRGKRLADGVPVWAREDRPLTVKVEVRGDRLKVQIDGHTAVEVRDVEGYAGGQLGLVTQAGGQLVVSRLHQISLAPPAVAAATAEPGFTSLVTADRTTGWEVEGTDREWEMVGGILAAKLPPRSRSAQGHVLSAGSFGDFVLRFDYSLAPGGSALISLRATPGETVEANVNGKPAKLLAHPWLRLFNSGEERLFRPPSLPMDDKTFRPAILERWFGSRVTRYPDARVAVLDRLAADEWHEAEVSVTGTTLAVTLDGERVTYPATKLDPKLNVPEFTAGLERKAGRIGFGPFAGEVRFRNIRVKELPPGG